MLARAFPWGGTEAQIGCSLGWFRIFLKSKVYGMVSSRQQILKRPLGKLCGFFHILIELSLRLISTEIRAIQSKTDDSTGGLGDASDIRRASVDRASA